MPPPSRAGWGPVLVALGWYLPIGIVALLVANGQLPALRDWLRFDFAAWLRQQVVVLGVPGVAASVIGAYYAMIAIHESGHALAGAAVGFRFRSIRVGWLVIYRSFRVATYHGPGSITNGVADLTPVATDHLAARGALMVLAGPVANFITAAAVLASPAPINLFTGGLLIFCLMNGVNDLIPIETRLGVSDGGRIWMLLRKRVRGERWLAVLRLTAEIADGVLPEAISPPFLDQAVAVRDDSLDTVSAHAFAYANAFHQRRDDDAARCLEICLAHATRVTPIARVAMMSDAAVFQARRRKNVALAEAWLADIPTGGQTAWLRSRADAAILEAKGDRAAALTKLAELEPSILGRPNGAQRATALILLDRWKAELVT